MVSLHFLSFKTYCRWRHGNASKPWMRQLWDCRCLWAMVKLVVINATLVALLKPIPSCLFCSKFGLSWLILIVFQHSVLAPLFLQVTHGSSQVIWFELYIAGISWDTSCQSLPWRLRSSTWPFIGTDFGNFNPDHEIFDILTNDQLQLTLPVKIHGDEGRRPLYFAKVIV